MSPPKHNGWSWQVSFDRLFARNASHVNVRSKLMQPGPVISVRTGLPSNASICRQNQNGSAAQTDGSEQPKQ